MRCYIRRKSSMTENVIILPSQQGFKNDLLKHKEKKIVDKNSHEDEIEKA